MTGRVAHVYLPGAVRSLCGVRRRSDPGPAADARTCWTCAGLASEVYHRSADEIRAQLRVIGELRFDDWLQPQIAEGLRRIARQTEMAAEALDQPVTDEALAEWLDGES